MVLEFIESFNKFDVKFISKDSSYVDKTPLSMASIDVQWNEAKIAKITCRPRTKADQEVLVDLTEVVRDDFAEVSINGAVRFFGRILKRMTKNRGNQLQFEFEAVQELRALTIKKFDRLFYNGYRDKIEYETFVDRTNEITPDRIVNKVQAEVVPMARVETFEPFGVIGEDLTGFTTTTDPIRYLATDDRVAIIFRAESNILEKVILMLFESNFTALPTLSQKLVLSVLGVIEDASGLRTPDASRPLFTLSGAPAIYEWLFWHKEMWRAACTNPGGNPCHTYSTPGNDVIPGADFKVNYSGTAGPAGTQGWNLDSAPGSSALEIWDEDVFLGGGGSKTFGRGAYVRMNYDGTAGNMVMATNYPHADTIDEFAPFQAQPQLKFQFRFIATGTTVNSIADPVNGGAVLPAGVSFSFRLYVEDGTAFPNKKLVCRVFTSSSEWFLEYGESLTQVKFADAQMDVFEQHMNFRIDPITRTFQFWFNKSEFVGATEPEIPITRFVDGSGNIDKGPRMEGLDFIERTGFLRNPQHFARYEFDLSGAAVYFELGNLGAHEIQTPDFGEGQTGTGQWSIASFEEDPVQLIRRNWYALELKMDTQDAVDDHVVLILAARSSQQATSVGEHEFVTSTDGGTTWAKAVAGATDLQYFFQLQFDDSWRQAIEGTDFVTDVENGFLDWSIGSNPNIIPFNSENANFLNDPQSRPHYAPIKFVRVSEYLNPSSGGIIDPNNKLNLSSLVKRVMTFFPAIAATIVDGNQDDTDDTFGTGYNSDSFAIGLAQAKQVPGLRFLRDLAAQYNAVITLSPEQNSTLKFQLAKDIVDFDEDNPGAHEYVLSLDDTLFETDIMRVIEAEVGPAEGKVYTRFPMRGATDEIQFTYINEALEAEIGVHEFDLTVFNKVTDITVLKDYAQALNQVFGLKIIEGKIRVKGLFPIGPDGLLDVNGIIRFFNRDIAGGDQKFGEGTDNVLKIHALSYDGSVDQTTISVSNRNLHRATEDGLLNQRNLIEGIDPVDPNLANKVIETVSGSISLTTYPQLYAALFVGTSPNQTEIDTARYERALCKPQILDNGLLAYIGFFGRLVGRIPNDDLPITEIRFHEGSLKSELNRYRVDIDAITTADPIVGQRMVGLTTGAIGSVVKVENIVGSAGELEYNLITTDVQFEDNETVEFSFPFTTTASTADIDGTPVKQTFSAVFTIDLSAPIIDNIFKWDDSTLFVQGMIDNSD